MVITRLHFFIVDLQTLISHCPFFDLDLGILICLFNFSLHFYYLLLVVGCHRSLHVRVELFEVPTYLLHRFLQLERPEFLRISRLNGQNLRSTAREEMIIVCLSKGEREWGDRHDTHCVEYELMFL